MGCCYLDRRHQLRDLGTRIEVESGIKAGDQVILNPPATLVDGSKVQIRPEETASNKITRDEKDLAVLHRKENLDQTR